MSEALLSHPGPVAHPGNPAAAVDARTLHKSFGNIHAVNGIDLNVAPGEIAAALGPNGAGRLTPSPPRPISPPELPVDWPSDCSPCSALSPPEPSSSSGGNCASGPRRTRRVARVPLLHRPGPARRIPRALRKRHAVHGAGPGIPRVFRGPLSAPENHEARIAGLRRLNTRLRPWRKRPRTAHRRRLQLGRRRERAALDYHLRHRRCPCLPPRHPPCLIPRALDSGHNLPACGHLAVPAAIPLPQQHVGLLSANPDEVLLQARQQTAESCNARAPLDRRARASNITRSEWVSIGTREKHVCSCGPSHDAATRARHMLQPGTVRNGVFPRGPATNEYPCPPRSTFRPGKSLCIIWANGLMRPGTCPKLRPFANFCYSLLSLLAFARTCIFSPCPPKRLSTSAC